MSYNVFGRRATLPAQDKASKRNIYLRDSAEYSGSGCSEEDGIGRKLKGIENIHKTKQPNQMRPGLY